MPGYRYSGRATPADPSAVLPRRGKTSVPEKIQARQARKILYNDIDKFLRDDDDFFRGFTF